MKRIFLQRNTRCEQLQLPCSPTSTMQVLFIVSVKVKMKCV